jgi:hypothetical protein
MANNAFQRFVAALKARYPHLHIIKVSMLQGELSQRSAGCAVQHDNDVRAACSLLQKVEKHDKC